MKSQAITQENIASVLWNDEYFKFCDFVGFVTDGECVSSDFVDCSFRGLDWYWGLFTNCNFVDCRFQDCRFAGTGFPETRFVDCTFARCTFAEDNLGRGCDLTKTIEYGCKLNDTSGFDPARPFELV